MTIRRKEAPRSPAGKSVSPATPPVKAAATKKPGLYANIQAKRERIAEGSGEHMRNPGDAGAPAVDAFSDTERKVAAKESRAGTAASGRAASTKAPAKKAPAKTTASRKVAAKTTAAKTSAAKKTAAKKRAG